jgi:DNA-binding transcriptional LysR family regulator
MRALNDFRLFVCVAQSSSLSEAARTLDVTPASVSATIKKLEQELGVPLLMRSTRALRLTQAGETFLEDCLAGLAIFEQAQDRLTIGQATLCGKVSLSLPSDLGRSVVVPWLRDFQNQYPQISLSLHVSDRVVDVFRNQVDLALRYGAPADSSLVSLAVAPDNRRTLCASPDYVARYGRPSVPQDLARHTCISFMLSDRPHDRWTFTQGQDVAGVDVSGKIRCDDGEVARRFALMGMGVVYKSYLDVARDLQSGALVRLLPDWSGEPAPLNLICPGRQHLRPIMRALHGHLHERMSTLLALTEASESALNTCPA